MRVCIRYARVRACVRVCVCVCVWCVCVCVCSENAVAGKNGWKRNPVFWCVFVPPLGLELTPTSECEGYGVGQHVGCTPQDPGVEPQVLCGGAWVCARVCVLHKWGGVTLLISAYSGVLKVGPMGRCNIMRKNMIRKSF